MNPVQANEAILMEGVEAMEARGPKRPVVELEMLDGEPAPKSPRMEEGEKEDEVAMEVGEGANDDKKDEEKKEDEKKDEEKKDDEEKEDDKKDEEKNDDEEKEDDEEKDEEKKDEEEANDGEKEDEENKEDDKKNEAENDGEKEDEEKKDEEKKDGEKKDGEKKDEEKKDGEKATRMEVSGSSASRFLMRRKASEELAEAPAPKQSKSSSSLDSVSEEDEEEELAEEMPEMDMAAAGPSRPKPSDFEVPRRKRRARHGISPQRHDSLRKLNKGIKRLRAERLTPIKECSPDPKRRSIRIPIEIKDDVEEVVKGILDEVVERQVIREVVDEAVDLVATIEEMGTDEIVGALIDIMRRREVEDEKEADVDLNDIEEDGQAIDLNEGFVDEEDMEDNMVEVDAEGEAAIEIFVEPVVANGDLVEEQAEHNNAQNIEEIEVVVDDVVVAETTESDEHDEAERMLEGMETTIAEGFEKILGNLIDKTVLDVVLALKRCRTTLRRYKKIHATMEQLYTLSGRISWTLRQLERED